MTGEPAVHRMAEPGVRVRAAFMLACLIAIAWMSVSLLGRPSGPYAEEELPDLAGLPILVPQIERLVPPRTGGVPEIDPGIVPGQPPAGSPAGGGESP